VEQFPSLSLNRTVFVYIYEMWCGKFLKRSAALLLFLLFQTILLLPTQTGATVPLKGLSHEIFMVIFWLEWIYLGLNENRNWFLNFKEGSSILDSYFKY
jgi:hypothetical protein